MRKFKTIKSFLALLLIALFASCDKKTEPSLYITGPVSPTESPIVFPVLYTGLTWESDFAGLQQIRPPLPLTFYVDSLWLKDHLVETELKQDSTTVTKLLPYVYYHKIDQDTISMFYTVNPIYDDLGDKYGPLLIFGRQNAGTDFSKKVDVKINYRK
jgi:hypothetical protein